MVRGGGDLPELAVSDLRRGQKSLSARDPLPSLLPFLLCVLQGCLCLALEGLSSVQNLGPAEEWTEGRQMAP